MTNRLWYATLLVTWLCSLSLAQAADRANGEALAQRWCSECHAVTARQTSPTGEAPPFATIAKTSALDRAKLAWFLLLPHPKMPDIGLSRSAADDLAAYIESLK
jgi:mono/diheme cytochrome c family protein